MAKAKKAKAEQRRPVTRADFIGAKMANYLWQLQYNKSLTEDERALAKKLCDQWDSIAVVKINNPIVQAELEKAMAAGELK